MTYSPAWTAGGSPAWGAITGTLSAQTDLDSALAGKQAAGSYQPLAAVLTGTTASFTTAQETKLSTLSGTSSGTNTGDQNLAPYATLASPTFTGTVSGITAAMVGLGNVTNVAQTSVTGLTGTQSVAAFKTGLTLVKGDVGLGSVDNTSDAGKPVSTAQQTALNLKANTSSLATVATSGSAADLTGNLPVARLNSGTLASATTFWRGDGTWAAASGGVSDGDKGDVAVSGGGTVWAVEGIASGNFTFGSTAQRITGDMSNGTLANRMAIQTSTLNSNTNLHVLPNGTSVTSGFKAESDPALALGQYVAMDIVGGTLAQFSSGIRGGAAYVPMAFINGGTERLRITSAGNIHTPAGSTSMVDGFIYIPAANGAPTGAATAISGAVPLYYNTSSNTLSAYDGGWQAVGGGSDPWTYLKLAADFPTSLATWTTVTGMQFTPAANTDYEVEWCLLCQTATTTVGARPGIAWGTGYQYGGVSLFTPSSATAQTIVNGSINNAAGTAQAAVGGLPIINRTYPHYGQATFRSGAVPTAFQLRLASETAATAVTAKAGSWLKYRTI